MPDIFMGRMGWAICLILYPQPPIILRMLATPTKSSSTSWTQIQGRLPSSAIGLLTNLAAAETKSPGILKKAKESAIVGGTFFCVGNVTPHAEFNIWFNAEAEERQYLIAEMILLKRAKVRVETKWKSTVYDRAKYNESQPPLPDRGDVISKSLQGTVVPKPRDRQSLQSIHFPTRERFEWWRFAPQYWRHLQLCQLLH